jgi:Mg/Co/Ni transporter MgtE
MNTRHWRLRADMSVGEAISYPCRARHRRNRLTAYAVDAEERLLGVVS